MVFRSKVDTYYLTVLFLAIVFVGAVTIIPALFDSDITRFEVALVSSFFLLTTVFLIWMSFSIQYRFEEDYLLVKGGLFRSKIAYKQITKISRTTEILTGYRILSSKDSLEVFYTTAALGSVKISPQEQAAFLEELKKRCPSMQVDIS